MLVYADRRTDSTLRSWVDEGCRALALARLQPGLDRLRDVLILAGQIEQAVYDQCGETSDFNGQSSEKPSDSSARLGTASELQALASRLTDEAAEGFYLVWSGAGAEHRIEDCLA